MEDLISLIRKQASAFSDQTIDVRRHLHRHPELSFQEYRTSEYLQNQLAQPGVELRQLAGDDRKGTGFIADIAGTGDNKTAPIVAMRADMDALPVNEENDIDFRSENPGVMHACGHDAHSAIVLSAGRILHSLRHTFSGVFRLIFQPAEERTPGGAASMIRQGALEGVDSIIGEHINPGLEAGTVGFRPGLMMASADEIYLSVRGRGGHAASPHQVIDPVLISSQILVSLQQVVSRQSNPEVPSVLSFGKVEAAGAMNVIPDVVEIAGTFRTVDEPWREQALESVRRIAEQTAAAMGGSCEVRIIRGYPVLENNNELNTRLRNWAEEYLGKSMVQDLPLVMWAEDFAYYNMETRGCFYNLGVANTEKGWASPLHSSTLMVDENALETGSGLMAWLALSEMLNLEQFPQGSMGSKPTQSASTTQSGVSVQSNGKQDTV